jgi:hypothetical protein
MTSADMYAARATLWRKRASDIECAEDASLAGQFTVASMYRARAAARCVKKHLPTAFLASA